MAVLLVSGATLRFVKETLLAIGKFALFLRVPSPVIKVPLLLAPKPALSHKDVPWSLRGTILLGFWGTP